jgi:hypothetical protein
MVVVTLEAKSVGPTKNPLAKKAQEVASERYVAFAVR